MRFYKSTNGEPLLYVKNGNKVARSDDAVPMMDLLEHTPDDLDVNWYIGEAHKLLANMGVNNAQA